jgi:hypothetical protein
LWKYGNCGNALTITCKLSSLYMIVKPHSIGQSCNKLVICSPNIAMSCDQQKNQSDFKTNNGKKI